MSKYMGNSVLRRPDGSWYIRFWGTRGTPPCDVGNFASRDIAIQEASKHNWTSYNRETPHTKPGRTVPVVTKTFDQRWFEGIKEFKKVGP